MRWWPLFAITVLAAALRWFRIDAQSLWYDEGISAHQLTRTFGEIVRAAALDTHPPGYYWTLKAWGEALGSSAFGLRSLSALCGVLAVVLTFLIGRQLFGSLAGGLAALLLATAPLAVYYSQEVRMYAQVTALGLLAVYAYVRRLHWLYALAGIATLYSQYLGAAMLIALNVHALIWWRSRSRREWLAWLGANAVIALAFFPWLPTFIDQQSHALNTSPRTAIGLAVDSFTAYGGGIAHGDVYLAYGAVLVWLAVIGAASSLIPRKTAGPAEPGLTGAAGPGLPSLLGNWLPSLAERGSLCLLVWLMPLGLVLALGLHSGLFEVRYLVLSLPGLALLAGPGVVRLARTPLAVVTLGGFVIAPAALGLWQQYFDPALARDDYRDLVAAIERDARPSDAIILSAPNQVEVFDYYYHGPLATIGIPAQRPIDPADTLQRLAAIRSQHDRIWLVSWAMGEADPKGVTATWLAENGFQATHAWYGTVQLALIGFGAADTPTASLETPLDNGIVLEGYRLETRSLKPGETLALTLLWRGDRAPTAERWKVFTHLLDAQSKVVAQRDAEPADNLRPTTTWQAGERVQDNYGIVVPDTLAPGNYTLEIGMYAGETRAIFQGQGDHLVLGQVEVLPY